MQGAEGIAAGEDNLNAVQAGYAGSMRRKGDNGLLVSGQLQKGASKVCSGYGAGGVFQAL